MNAAQLRELARDAGLLEPRGGWQIERGKGCGGLRVLGTLGEVLSAGRHLPKPRR
jgi:hypothetical protein